MSEVVAKYMGCEYDNEMCKIPKMGWIYYDDIDWEWIHEIWEKVRYQNIPVNADINYSLHLDKIQDFIIENLKLQAFTALFNCIQFINQLK
jgi:hypothetical protein